MHIALFGASFDPPHMAHRIITEQLLDQKLVDQVWLVPVKEHPFGKDMTQSGDRLAMVKFMLEKIARPKTVFIDEYELTQDKPSYSFDTLEAMSRKFPEHTFSWVIGTDNLKSFAKWHEAHKLLEKYTVFVYPRAGSDSEPLLPGMKRIEHVPEINISSTDIRQKVKQGESITGLVELEVAQYIKEKELYVYRSTTTH